MDECETGVCAEECLNTPGSFRCFCDGRQGRKLSQDLRSCKVNDTNSRKRNTNNQGCGNSSLNAGGFIISNFLPAFNSLYVTASEEEPPFPLPWPHVQRRSDGEASFSPENSHWVREKKKNAPLCLSSRGLSRCPLRIYSCPSPPQTSFSAEFDFRTYDPEGVIFFAGGHLNSSWIVLAMHHGKLELQLKYGSVSRVTSSGPVVNDGQWRKVGVVGLGRNRPAQPPGFTRLCAPLQISVEEQGRSLVIKIDREAVMKIAVNGDLFTLRKGVHELNLTVGGVPFREDGLVNQVVVLVFQSMPMITDKKKSGSYEYI